MKDNPPAQSSELNEILQRAFLYGCEVGRLDKNYKVSGVEYVPTGEIAQLEAYLNQKIVEELESIPPIPSFLYSVRNDDLKRQEAMRKSREASVYLIDRINQLKTSK